MAIGHIIRACAVTYTVALSLLELCYYFDVIASTAARATISIT